jgi:epoxyqueuosine reductase
MSAARPQPPDLGDLEDATPEQRRHRLLAACRELGFAHAGICSARRSDREAELRRWIESGRHGSMHYLAERVDAMIDPEHVLEGARSIICLADRYHGGRDRIPEEGPARGRIARYARGRDYHDVLRRRLDLLAQAIKSACPQSASRGVVDTAPLMEREHATRAGLGLIGKHTLVIHPGEGSWLLLGEVLTTLEVEPDRPIDRPDPCGSCTRCIDACPTGAIEPFKVDGSRCLAYTTIEHREAVDPDLYEATGDWLFGCDICQEVCPHNQPTRGKRGLEVLEAYDQRRDGFDLLEVLGWREEDRREAFITSALKRAKLPMFKRNAVICAGNALQKRADPALKDRLVEIAEDPEEDPIVAETARTVLKSL